MPYIVDAGVPVQARRRERVLVPRLPLVARPDPAGRHPVERRRLLLGHPARGGEPAAAARARRDLPLRRHPPLRLARSRRPTRARSAPGPTAWRVNLPHFLQNYRAIWDAGRDELEATWDYFQGVDLAPCPPATCATCSARAAATTSAPWRSTSTSCTRCWSTSWASTAPAPSMGINPNRDRQVPPGRGHQDHGDRPRAVPARDARPGRPGCRTSSTNHEPHELRAALVRARRRRRRSGSPTSTTSCRSTATARRPPATSGVPSWIEDNTDPARA